MEIIDTTHPIWYILGIIIIALIFRVAFAVGQRKRVEKASFLLLLLMAEKAGVDKDMIEYVTQNPQAKSKKVLERLGKGKSEVV